MDEKVELERMSNYNVICEIKKKKNSGKTFYVETFEQIDHLINILEEYFANTKWHKIFETPLTTNDVFTYFKYMAIVYPDGRKKLVAIIQFPTRKTANSAKRLFADSFGIFKLSEIERVEKPLIIVHLKMKVLEEIPNVVVERKKEWNEFSFGGASHSVAKTSMKYLKALSNYKQYTNEIFYVLQQLGNLLSLCKEIAGARNILQKFENLKGNTSGICIGDLCILKQRSCEI